ncbi:hypothetical protein KKE60_06580, partial [Patescibacteria group bacterium]|nr:hypothetical protein [Patescibacteria group bacterium]
MTINKTFLFIPDDDAGDLYLDIDTGNILGVFSHEYETSERDHENPLEMMTSEDIVIGFKAPVKDAELVILVSGFGALDEANRALKLDIIKHLE